MVKLLLLSFLIIALAMLGMAVGVLFKGQSFKRTCAGPYNDSHAGECDVCAGSSASRPDVCPGTDGRRRERPR